MRRMQTLTVHRDLLLPADESLCEPLERDIDLVASAAMLIGSWALCIGTGMLIYRAGRH